MCLRAVRRNTLQMFYIKVLLIHQVHNQCYAQQMFNSLIMTRVSVEHI